MSHGGARRGAGRKPAEEARRSITLTVPVSMFDRIRVSPGDSIGSKTRLLLEWALNQQQPELLSDDLRQAKADPVGQHSPEPYSPADEELDTSDEEFWGDQEPQAEAAEKANPGKPFRAAFIPASPGDPSGGILLTAEDQQHLSDDDLLQTARTCRRMFYSSAGEDGDIVIGEWTP